MYQLSMLLMKYLLLTIINPTRGNLLCKEELCSCCRSGKCADSHQYVLPCQGCKDGFAGPGCYEPCPTGCVNCSQLFYEYESERVCYQCKPGYYKGKHKDISSYPLIQECSLPCIENCEMCTSYYNCSRCKPQFYLTYEKACVKCTENCLQCTSGTNCLACEDGYVWDGKFCAACPANCVQCRSGSDCLACEDGYFWNGVECVTCEAGYFGKKCSARCPEHCNNCLSNDVCVSCTQGFMGDTCHNKCSDCKPGTECDRVTGYCFDSCQIGFSGENCNLPCHSNCFMCERENPYTCVSCASDRYGSGLNCIFQCSMNCINGTCSDTDGKCTRGCEHGYWGDTCEHNCAKDCLVGKCERIDGACLKTCYDTDSSDTFMCVCPTNCECDRDNHCARCLNTYGELCDKPCSERCVDKKCVRKTGECLYNCLPGHSGTDCSIGPGNEVKTSPLTAVLATIFSLVGVASVCGILIRKGFRIRQPLQWVQTRMTNSGRRLCQRILDSLMQRRNNDDGENPGQNSEGTDESLMGQNNNQSTGSTEAIGLR